jgi:NitT/TauT family transport system substrate-binding protein
LKGVAGLGLSVAGGSLLAGCGNQIAPFFAGSSGSRPETNTIRLPSGFATCIAPLFLAADLLRADGFTVEEVPMTTDGGVFPAISAGELDVAMQTSAMTVTRADTTSSFVHLAGIHTGCFELFANPGTRSILDLRGKRVAVFGDDAHVYLGAMAAFIGLDPTRDFTMVIETSGDAALQAFVAGQIDAFLAGPPQPQQLRKLGVGRVIMSMQADRPWSQQFCCMLIGSRAFVQNNPIAAKHTVRAVLKAAELCDKDPNEAAQRLLARGDITDYDATVQMFSHDASYNRWREYDPEASLRFYALLLHQVGMIKSTPNKLIEQSTDWRILNELKRELKA